jgi:glycosyltransferase involved in cell wall biosynthesis
MKSVAVSIVLPFRDHEHLVGRATRGIAEHFEKLGHRFEIIAVDEGSGDNSHAVLALLRQEIPALRVVVGKGYAAGTALAEGNALLLLDLTSAAELSPSIAQALERVLSGELDMQLIAENLLVCNREKSLHLVTEGLAKRQLSARGLLKRGRSSGLVTETYGPESRSLSDSGLGRIVSALVPRATGLTSVW